MSYSNTIVISEKIYNKNSLLKTKSLVASFGVHAALLASVSYLIASHPIPLPKAEEKISISLSNFPSTNGDINRLESSVTHTEPPKPKSVQPLKPKKPLKPVIAKPLIATTPERTPSPTPSVSPEASAPLAVPQVVSSVPLSKNENDSPHLSVSKSVNELPKKPVSENQIGGAALGHIRAMIENAITYPSIARKLHIEGVVIVSFVLKPNGMVETAEVITTSGTTLLDAKAIQTILSLSGDYPALGKTFELSIPIAFNLHKS
jgi:periplasmic protein TonB